MASNANQKPGLTTFGWLALGAAATAVLANPARREKLKGGAIDLFGKLRAAASTKTSPETPA
ncbi:hypothetical protein HL653_18430 [Sphingomonas sp. AP4-R1]|uniref:hypothetical protein n=1 Tax=Sphingomonas sp. AP4-R1 TaxID=2735134 RepID=UPI001493574C|nr:hypothetical protein [Sphingomonas sp. AP4-R1]QJU59465.1 hypothetical protein HL653_18430 [Sphingomonas sp. AP4-R1]